MKNRAFYQSLLQEEFSRRTEKNPKYSLRAFAKGLRVDPASLSKILSSKMVPSWKLAQKILPSLDLSPEEEKAFLISITEIHRARSFERLSPSLRTFEKTVNTAPRELSTEAFRVIADWYHYAVLELTYTRGFKADPQWIATALGISVMEVKLAIQRLVSLELLTESNGTLKKTDAQTTTADRSLTTPAHRRRQRQVLEKAIQSLEDDPIEIRDTTALCMAIDSKKIPEAKRRIQAFKRELCAFLESGARDCVYELAISLFPTQKKQNQLTRR